jgi:cell division protein FtsL
VIAKQIFQYAMPAQVVVMLLLVFLIMVSGMSVAFVKYESRRLFTEMEKLRTYRDELVVEWGRLQIELATWAEHGRVEELAINKLQMHVPSETDIRVIGQE